MTQSQGTNVSVKLTDGRELHGLEWSITGNMPTIVIAHGINEHIGRYAHVAAALNERGFSAIGFDHRGHGRSAPEGKRTSNERQFDHFVDDYLEAIQFVADRTGRKPVALGHSMGGLVAARAALRQQAKLDALILSGPALMIPFGMPDAVRKVVLALSGGLSFLKVSDGALDGLSRDPEVRKQFESDPLCINDPIRLGIASQLYINAEKTRARAEEITLPLLVMCGVADKICDPEGAREFVKRAASTDKMLILWPEDQHEIFNELNGDEVIAAMTTWLTARFNSAHSEQRR